MGETRGETETGIAAITSAPNVAEQQFKLFKIFLPDTFKPIRL